VAALAVTRLGSPAGQSRSSSSRNRCWDSSNRQSYVGTFMADDDEHLDGLSEAADRWMRTTAKTPPQQPPPRLTEQQQQQHVDAAATLAANVAGDGRLTQQQQQQHADAAAALAAAATADLAAAAAVAAAATAAATAALAVATANATVWEQKQQQLLQ